MRLGPRNGVVVGQHPQQHELLAPSGARMTPRQKRSIRIVRIRSSRTPASFSGCIPAWVCSENFSTASTVRFRPGGSSRVNSCRNSTPIPSCGTAPPPVVYSGQLLTADRQSGITRSPLASSNLRAPARSRFGAASGRSAPRRARRARLSVTVPTRSGRLGGRRARRRPWPQMGQRALARRQYVRDAAERRGRPVRRVAPGDLGGRAGPARSCPAARCPRSPGGFDPPERLDAFLDAVRWGAVDLGGREDAPGAVPLRHRRSRTTSSSRWSGRSRCRGSTC